MCSSISAVKYLYKYVYKGHDRALVGIEPDDAIAGQWGPNDGDGAQDGGERSRQAAPGEAAAQGGGDLAGGGPPLGGEGGGAARVRDELKQFVDGRYVSASEAHYRVCGFELHKEVPQVVRLQVHLPDQQRVTFVEGQEQQAVDRPKPTTLTAWFACNAQAKADYDAALAAVQAVGQEQQQQPVEPPCLKLLYHNMPRAYRWDVGRKEWRPRQKPQPFPPIGRMYFVHPTDEEKFYLRVLLCHVHGATGFEDLRTVGDVQHDTFKGACIARGLVENDSEWEDCLREGESFRSERALRQLFATILAYNNVSDPRGLWDKFKPALCADFLHTARLAHPSRELDREIEQQALWDIDRVLGGLNKRLADFPGMPTLDSIFMPQSDTLAQERARYPIQGQRDQLHVLLPQLNQGQRCIFDAVMHAVTEVSGRGGDAGGDAAEPPATAAAPPTNTSDGTAFFVDGLGGAGKTFLYKTLLCGVRARGLLAIATASSGIAALLLPGGRTAHTPRSRSQ